MMLLKQFAFTKAEVTLMKHLAQHELERACSAAERESDVMAETRLLLEIYDQLDGEFERTRPEPPAVKLKGKHDNKTDKSPQRDN